MEVGVIIGRFQVDELHEGHKFLIQRAITTHHKVIVFIGCSPRPYSQKNPLDYPTRERMIRAAFPTVTVMPLRDMASDVEWSKQVDDLIGVVAPYGKAVMLGGRDSFVPHYVGKHKAIEIDSPIAYQSGTQRRLELGKIVRESSDFRAGSIYHSQNNPIRPIMGVDIAIISYHPSRTSAVILMGRKTWDSAGLWRFPGGKLEVEDVSLEQAAKRELKEETDVLVESPLTYLGSFQISDWRDKDQKDLTYMSALFVVEYEESCAGACPQSDLVTLEWQAINLLTPSIVIPEHLPLYNIVKEYLVKEGVYVR